MNLLYRYTVSFLFLCCLAAAAGAADLPPAGAVNGPDALKLMEALGENLLILDVRTEEEFAQNHLPGALLVPVLELENHLGAIAPDRPILIVCRTGRRAATAYDLLRKARPEALDIGLWYLKATPEYKPDGSFVLP